MNLIMMNTLLIISLITVLSVAEPSTTVTSSPPAKVTVDLSTTIECHRRNYTYKASQSDAQGRKCWQYISAMSCWGRCDSGEISDWRFPYKITYHPVCGHGTKSSRLIELAHCDYGVSEETRYYTIVEAVTCSCQVCTGENMSCLSIPGY